MSKTTDKRVKSSVEQHFERVHVIVEIKAISSQEVRKAIEVSESTLYPVLRRLQKDGCLETYDMEFAGRNRRYYKITDTGMVQLRLYMDEWVIYYRKINNIFEGVK